jgi:pimeloyl-ACP methyl ester carboxylesterase
LQKIAESDAVWEAKFVAITILQDWHNWKNYPRYLILAVRHSIALLMNISTINSSSDQLSCSRIYHWQWQNQNIAVVYDVQGISAQPSDKQSVLLLPAFSTVCSRTEMAEIARSLSANYQVTSIDWPGFGDSGRPQASYNPEFYQQFLADFVRDCLPHPTSVVAAGHTAGYVLQLAQMQRNWFDRLILVAPTWRGPLPSMMNGQKPWFKFLRGLVRTPVLGQALYGVNTTKGFLDMMYRRHVYANPDSITPELIATKRQISQQPGARFAPVAFVTGGLDPVVDRSSFHQLCQDLKISVIIGADSPPKSLAEMRSLAELPGVTSVTLPGTLGMHEEYATLVAAEIINMLGAAH